MKNKRLIVLSSPSGGGKSTLAKHILGSYDNIRFSVSCATRNKREGEIDGVHYHFIEKEKFESMIENNELIEYEKIFENYYGTRKSDIEVALINGEYLLFDIDYKGALNLRKTYPEETLLIFIAPPDFATLEDRLRKRSTESEEQIQIRLSRAKMEIDNSSNFDVIIINDKLDDAIDKLEEILGEIELKKIVDMSNKLEAIS